MRRLSSLDSFFLAAEDGRTVTNVSALAIVESRRDNGSRIVRDDLVAMVRDRIHLLPPLYRRLVQVPFGLGHPYWVDTEVDLDFHIREITLPAPGDRHRLQEQVARLANHPMDRSRPLWEIYLIQGLEGDRCGLLTKLHHSEVDGVSGAEVMSVLLDGSPVGRTLPPAPPRTAERLPGQLELLARGAVQAAGQPVRATGAGWRTLTHLDHVVTMRWIPGIRTVGRTVRRVTGFAGTAPRDGDILDAPTMVAPRTHLNGTLSRRRRFTMLSLPLAPVRDLKHTHGTTVNDVVVTLCAGALRGWLGATDQLPTEPLVAAIPVSVRTDAERGTFGNAIGTMVIALPTDEPDAARRLDRCREELQEAKDRHRATPAGLMRDATDTVPPVLFGRVTRAITGLAATEGLHPAANLVISNVPGSRSPLYCAGARVLEHYPVSTISDSLGLNITVFSYLDQLNIGLVADRDLVPDLEGLADAIRTEFRALTGATPATAPAATPEGNHR